MSIRRQLYDLLASLPDRDPVARIAATGAYLDSLPPEQVAAAERRLLAFTQVYRELVTGGLDPSFGDFFGMIDAAERRLVN